MLSVFSNQHVNLSVKIAEALSENRKIALSTVGKRRSMVC